MVTAAPGEKADVARVLGLDDDLLAACVSCGLCLPHCPTYRATEEESASPRGRITLMRAAEKGEVAIDDDFVDFLQRCVMCRGCETACPSGVHFGALMEGTRTALAASGHGAPRVLRWGLSMLRHHRTIVLGSRVLGVAQRLRLVPTSLAARVGLPARIPLRRERLRADEGLVDAWLFTGCVMDAWQRDVHAAALRVMRATGATVGLPLRGGECCGALHAHAGLHDGAQALARRVIGAFPGDAAIVVDSAGCGAALKDYGHLLGTPEAISFSARVRDIGEWLASRVELLPAAAGRRYPHVVALQDACHLRHVQRAHLPVRTVLSPFADLVELDDDGRCCGAGGSYQVTQPELAVVIRAQKVDAIRRSGASVVSSGNPGCSMWLEAAGLRVRHPVQIIDDVLQLGAAPA